MITNTHYNNQLAFTSTIRMSQKTAKLLNQEPRYIKKALFKDLETLSNNGRDDVVNISFKKQVSKNINPMSDQICEEKVLNLELVEKRGSEYYSAKTRKSINLFNQEYYEPLNVMGLYRNARKNMKPCASVSNKFMQFV